MAYTLWMTITVDAPEKRGPTYPVVAAGKRLAQRHEFARHNEALALFNSAAGGEWDFGSEYVSRLSLSRDNGQGGYGWVRRELSRHSRSERLTRSTP